MNEFLMIIDHETVSNEDLFYIGGGLCGGLVTYLYAAPLPALMSCLVCDLW